MGSTLDYHSFYWRPASWITSGAWASCLGFQIKYPTLNWTTTLYSRLDLVFVIENK
jgi:hypothetical protein